MHAGSLEMTLNLRYAIRYLHRDVTHTTEFVTSTSLAAFQFYGVISMCVCACVCTWGVTASGQLNIAFAICTVFKVTSTSFTSKLETKNQLHVLVALGNSVAHPSIFSNKWNIMYTRNVPVAC